MYGTPVLGADIGGIPELIRPGETGELFESGDAAALREKILQMWHDREWDHIENNDFDSVTVYAEKLMNIYQ